MHRFRTIGAAYARPLNAAISAAAFLFGVPLLVLSIVALTAAAAASPGNDNRAPELEGAAAKLRVEAGNKVAFHAYAHGVQIYQWNGASWVFVAPEAVLFADTDDADAHGVIGVHYAGPTWESASGSKVVATLVDRATVDPTAIDWFLLKAASSTGPGIFNGITFIQRLNTIGGKPPTAPGEFIGDEARVPYTADYYFYRQAQH